MKLTVTSPELGAAIAGLRAAPGYMYAALKKYTAEYMIPAWKEELVNSPVVSTVQRAVLIDTASATTFVEGFTLTAGDSTSPLRGGLVPSIWARAFEFGTSIVKRRTFQQHSRKGTLYTVHNKMTTNQMPRRSRSGWAVYPGATRVTKRAFGLYAQIILRTWHDGAEGRIK